MGFSIRCLLLGHDDSMVRAPERLRLRCDHCGRETPGWTLAPTGAKREAESTLTSMATRRRVASLHERRIAA